MGKQIITLGGGGFWTDPHSPVDDYILSCAGKQRARICLLATASGDRPDVIVKFYESFHRRSCDPTHLSLFRSFDPITPASLTEQDIIYVGGGNTRSMLALWREWGVSAALEDALKSGAVLCGVSAGAVCWFEQALTDSVLGLAVIPGLGFLKGSATPHYDTEAARRPTFERLIGGGALTAGYGIDEGAAMHFVDGELFAVVATKSGATAHYVERSSTGSATRAQPARLLA